MIPCFFGFICNIVIFLEDMTNGMASQGRFEVKI